MNAADSPAPIPPVAAKPPLLVLVGPTAVGKTEIAIALAHLLAGEVITADSMQVYRGMDVATAKPRPAETKGIPHHLIDVADPHEPFNVARYRRLAREAIAAVHQRGNLPMLSGGTGLYIKAVLGDFLFPDPGADPALRAELERSAQEEGAAAMHARLARVDAAAAARLHPNDTRRVIRALEVWERTGRPLTAHLAGGAGAEECPYRTVKVGLTRERSHLYQRIDQRVLAQVANGLLAETAALMAAGLFASERSVAAQALGYKEMRAHLLGCLTLDEAIAELQKATRHYAKRQYTWFRRDTEIQWFNLDEYDSSAVAAAAIAAMVRARLQWTKSGPPQNISAAPTPAAPNRT